MFSHRVLSQNLYVRFRPNDLVEILVRLGGMYVHRARSTEHTTAKKNPENYRMHDFEHDEKEGSAANCKIAPFILPVNCKIAS